MENDPVRGDWQITAPVESVDRFARVGWTGLAIGLASFTGLLVYRGVGEVMAALAMAGASVFGVAAFHVVPMLADALGWRRLLAGPGQPGVGRMLFARWIGESVNGLLPVLQVGGNVVKARLVAQRAVPGVRAGASVVVDVTLVLTSQVLFTFLGLALLAARMGGGGVVRTVAAGAVLMALALAGFHAFQRRGGFAVLARGVERMTSGRWRSLVAGADALDRDVASLYADRRTIAVAWTWHLASWIVGIGEVWLALWCLGQPVDLATAALLESLGQAVRAAAFAVPAALGIQEGGYLALGAALGIPPTTALALSLVKRVRELTLGIPGLVCWQLARTPALDGGR